MDKDYEEYENRLNENQKKHITEFIEKLKQTSLKDITKYKSVKCYDTTFNNSNGDYCTEDIFDIISSLLYTYSAKSIYHMRLLEIKQTLKNVVEVEILIGDFYWGSMMSSNFIITIVLE